MAMIDDEASVDNHLDAETDKIARALCQEQCAFYGEPPCWFFEKRGWPNSECNEPGCVALAMAAKAAGAQKP